MAIDQIDVRLALERGEFIPYFQPVVQLRTRTLEGFELLARWQHPDRGLVAPDEFIGRAERDGWIDQLTQVLFLKGFEAVTTLPGTPTLAVNLSPVLLHEEGLPLQIEKAAAAAGFPLERLVLEITESALMGDITSARKTAEAFKKMGCRLALDDFGTGYSSLLHLQSLPFDELKVDRSFVGTMTQQRDSRKIVAAVVGLGQSLGLTTVAEGVETEEQAEMLLWLGCELGQGWLYGRPMPAESLADVLLEIQVQQARTQPPGGVAGRESVSSLESLPGQRLAQLQAVYDGAPVGLAFLDRNMRYMTLNQRLANMNGRPLEEHLGRTVQEMIPALFPTVEPFIRRALQGEAIPGVEVVKPSADSREPMTILLSYEPARDEAGEIVGVSVSLVDVTPIKRAEASQRETEEHFRYFMELIPQIPWVIDPQGRALDVSQRWLELTGSKDDQWRDFAWLDALHPDDRQATIDGMQRSFASGEPIDLQYRVRPSADRPWTRLRARGAARRCADGSIVCWYGVLEPVEDTAPTD